MFRSLLQVLCTLTLISTFSTVSADSPQEITQLADYISVDYPDAIKDGVIINEAEYQEMEEFSAQINALGQTLPLEPVVLQNMQELSELIKNKAQPSTVANKARQISLTISNQFNLIIPPKQTPNLAAASQLYQQQCASCHGASGQGDGVLATQLEPRPTAFTDLQRAQLRSINGLYNTITMGVAETGMAPYAQTLTENERWALAFYVSQLFANADELAAGAQQWQQLADKAAFTPERLISRTLTEEMTDHQSVALIAYLRHNPAAVWSNQPEKDLWLVTEHTLTASFQALSAGETKQAYQLALSAYLDGFELLEAVIDTVNPEMRLELEKSMLHYRQAVQENNVIAAEEYLTSTKTLLAQAKQQIAEEESNFFAVLLSAFIILLREGLEIILILSVMLVLAKRTEQKRATTYLHAGWISAVVIGIGLWYLSHQFIQISGGEREVTEGLLTLLAAAILFYVGFWIHRQSTAQQWQKTLQTQMNKQMAKHSLIGLSFIAFIAVFREMLEIALFYETLWLQTQTQAQHSTAIFFGIGIALMLLLVINYAINKLSVRLPIKQFFLISSLVIIVLAVIFLGSGLQALTEAGRFPLLLINVPQIDLLGIYPNLWILLAQLCLIVIGGYIWYKQQKK